jgi:hypothetical protein
VHSVSIILVANASTFKKFYSGDHIFNWASPDYGHEFCTASAQDIISSENLDDLIHIN